MCIAMPARSTSQARLKLFADVCAAVAHAHANLVVHRDIKPSNILVTSVGEVKLLDFGIGKILEAEDSGAERTELTRVTGRVFTPEFAAPEQILGEPVTTATDVYSLGTLLYVLLAGVRPFGNEVSGSKVEHAVLHDEPESLSRAAGTGRTRRSRRCAASRRSDCSAHWPTTSKTSCTWRCASRRRERYGSVMAMAEDLARYTRHEPVAARAGSRAYRMNRFVRRHRVGVAAAAGVVLAATFGVAGVLYQAREAREQARVAKLEAAKATSVKDYLLKIFEANSERHPDGAAARKTTAEELMDIATTEILAERFAGSGGTHGTHVRVARASMVRWRNIPSRRRWGKRASGWPRKGSAPPMRAWPRPGSIIRNSCARANVSTRRGPPR